MEGRMLAQQLQGVGRATLAREDGQSGGLPDFPLCFCESPPHRREDEQGAGSWALAHGN